MALTASPISRRALTREESTAYKMIVPYVVVVLVLIVYLLFDNIRSSFVQPDGTFGLANYLTVLSHERFGRIVYNTFAWTFFSVAGQVFLGLTVALFLNSASKGQTLLRTAIIILPWGTLDIVAGVTWRWMYNDIYGVINAILRMGGVIDGPFSWLGTPNMALAAVIIANIWKGFVLPAMFFLARLKGIPAQLYEVAEIDGAGVVRRFFSVTLPQLRSVMLTVIMLAIVWTINYFPLIYIMTGGGPRFGTETLVTHIHRLGFRFLERDLAAALSNMLFIVMLTIIIIFLRFLNREEVE
jgi:multiple sugar transport system permease protein